MQFSQSLGNKLGLIQSKLPILEESTRHDGVGQTTASIHIKAAGSIAERCVVWVFVTVFSTCLVHTLGMVSAGLTMM